MMIQELMLDEPEKLNARLYSRFMELSGSGQIRQSHYFEGRFENIYIDETDIPDIAKVLDVVKQRAGQLLGVTADTLRAGFWFNAMGAGHRTMPHHHDENDELLSAVYYIHVPDNSGVLILHDDEKEIVIQPQEGKLVLFPPGMLHEVAANLGKEMRLSVAMNVGPAGD